LGDRDLTGSLLSRFLDRKQLAVRRALAAERLIAQKLWLIRSAISIIQSSDHWLSRILLSPLAHTAPKLGLDLLFTDDLDPRALLAQSTNRPRRLRLSLLLACLRYRLV